MTIDPRAVDTRVKLLTAHGRRWIRYGGPPPGGNAGGVATTRWALVRQGLLYAKSGGLTPMGEAVKGKLQEQARGV